MSLKADAGPAMPRPRYVRSDAAVQPRDASPAGVISGAATRPSAKPVSGFDNSIWPSMPRGV
jgi:hypothetical protein